MVFDNAGLDTLLIGLIWHENVIFAEKMTLQYFT